MKLKTEDIPHNRYVLWAGQWDMIKYADWKYHTELKRISIMNAHYGIATVKEYKFDKVGIS